MGDSVCLEYLEPAKQKVLLFCAFDFLVWGIVAIFGIMVWGAMTINWNSKDITDICCDTFVHTFLKLVSSQVCRLTKLVQKQLFLEIIYKNSHLKKFCKQLCPRQAFTKSFLSLTTIHALKSFSFLGSDRIWNKRRKYHWIGQLWNNPSHTYSETFLDNKTDRRPLQKDLIVFSLWDFMHILHSERQYKGHVTHYSLIVYANCAAKTENHLGA